MRISDWSSDVCSSDLRIGKDKIEALVQYFLDVVPPEPWGLPLTAHPAASSGSSSGPSLHGTLSPEAQHLVDLIRTADTSQSVSADSWKQLAGIVKAMMKLSSPAAPVPKGFRK